MSGQRGRLVAETAASIQYVAYRGGRVAQIENVIVDPSERGNGVGEAMMRWAIEEEWVERLTMVQYGVSMRDLPSVPVQGSHRSLE